MKVNRYDNFTKCRSLILGSLNWSLLELIEGDEDRKYFTDVFHSVDETLSEMKKVFLDFGIKVVRPKPLVVDKDRPLVTPFLTMPAVSGSLSPYDTFLCLKDTVVECPSINDVAFFDHVQYKHIWQECFDNGSKWMAGPIPTHSPDQFELDEDRKYGEILFDGPALEPVGDVLLSSEKVVINDRGRKWIEQWYPEFKHHVVKGTNGHLDGYFTILKPGVIMSIIPKDKLPDIFKSWTVIQPPAGNFAQPEITSRFIQDDDFENTTIGVNNFSIDEGNIVVMKNIADHHPDVIREIEKHGINCIPIQYDAIRVLGIGFSCMTGAISRDGGFENYF
jgi:hypothetical protein|tara:strand:- start:114 stop:1115 length:1002 start_codon:yes stop_codon:yes gene_type:complete